MFAARALERAIALLAALRRRLIPAPYAALELATGAWPALAFRAMLQSGALLRLARGPLDPQALAKDLAVRADALARILGLLAGYGVVREDRFGRFSLTRVGRAAIDPDGVGNFVRYLGEPWQLEPWRLLDRALTSPVPPFETISGKPFFAFIAEEREAAAVFDAAMRDMALLAADEFARSYGFRSLTHVVDVGGGDGTVLAVLLDRYPCLRGTLLERGRAADTARERLKPFGERAAVTAGDFFDDVPRGADAYLMMHVLHDWDDASALRILRTIRAALTPRAVVLSVEWMLSGRRNAFDRARLADVQMLAVLPGRERTRAELRALYERAGLRMRVLQRLRSGEVVCALTAPS